MEENWKDAHFVLCRPDKTPIAAGWQKTRPTLDQARAHRRAGGALGLIPASLGLLAIDVDSGGERAARDIAAYFIAGEASPALVKSPRGWHVLLRYQGPALGNRAWAAFGGAGDLRHARGYIIIWDWAPWEEILDSDSPADEGLLAPFLSKPAPAASPQGETGLHPWAPGKRNNTLNALVYQRAKGAGPDVDISDLTARARAAGLGEAEIAATVRSALSAAAGSALGENPYLTVGELLDYDAPPALLRVGEQDILPGAGVTQVYGAPGVGKSTILLRWSLEIARTAPVVYYILEGEWDMRRNRVRAALEAYETRAENLRFSLETINLGDAGWMEAYARGIAGLPFKPALAVVDTFNRAFGGVNENDNSLMAEVIKRAGSLAPSVLIAHHPRKSDEETRGASAILAALDSAIQFKAAEGRVKVVSKKSRWSAPFSDFFYELRQAHGSVIAVAAGAGAEDAEQRREPGVKDKIMAAVAAGQDSQETIADYVGMSRWQCTPYIKELVAEEALVEEKGPHNRKIYHKPDPTPI